MRSFLALDDIDPGELHRIVSRSVEVLDQREPLRHELGGKVLGLYFAKTSTRTRTAFTSAAVRLGAAVVPYGPADLQLNTGESLPDTGRVFGAMLDGLVMRTAGPLADMRLVASAGGLPVVNAMAAEEHPTQGVCDAATMLRHFGRVDDLSVLYVGEGNNTAAALGQVLSAYRGVTVVFATPKGYGLDAALLDALRKKGSEMDSRFHETHDLASVEIEADVVYTTRWQTTGTAKTSADWREEFRPFHVDDTMMSRWPEAVFMHDLPAHRGDEVGGSVLDGDRSLAWEQAWMKYGSAVAILEWVYCDSANSGAPESGQETTRRTD
ncbi:ornithine carbamoyltransferase [Amycolatopsis sp. PS_44_ISF1]|uniref:ornithine carbamoyltransferase n=1 Tax=Amycolatopsis sp. PS_44_ISF1 TaxID=2974917 RepID=UPI0028DDF336|nr:ornithine carbamoyltransferase [Amycolatopsis sp. PS_44_ISF1]MDT8915998.1 ornithine carbamoyltransferase [Amycolatopsis sp. PS_44_ISF1]